MKYAGWVVRVAIVGSLVACPAVAQPGMAHTVGGGLHGPGSGSGAFHGRARMGGAGMRGHGKAMFAELDLTAGQRAKAVEIHDRQMRKAIPIESDLRLARLDMHQLLRADTPDARAIEAQIDRIAAIQASLHKLRLAGMLELRNTLTPAQREKFQEHFPGHGGMGMGSGRGHLGSGVGFEDEPGDDSAEGGSDM